MSQNAPSSEPPPVDYDPEPCLALSHEQLKAIPLLLEGRTDVSVAESIGIDRKTIYRWRMHDLNFADELKRARTEIFRSCVDRLCNLLHTALDVLERQVKEKYAPTCHRAARAILSLAGVGRAAAQLVKPPMQHSTTPGHRYSDAPDPSRNRSDTGVRSANAPKSPTMTPAGARAIAKAIDAMNILGLGPSSATT